MIWCQEMSALVGIVAPDGSISSSMDETMNMKPMKLRFALTTVRRPNEPPLEFIHLGLTSLEIRQKLQIDPVEHPRKIEKKHQKRKKKNSAFPSMFDSNFHDVFHIFHHFCHRSQERRGPVPGWSLGRGLGRADAASHQRRSRLVFFLGFMMFGVENYENMESDEEN